jgi:hypothetical protein
MAKATRTPGIPATSEERTVSIRSVEELQEGDTVEYTSVFDNGADVIRKIEVPAIPVQVVLELTEDEARFLVDVMRSIDRGPTSRRRFSDGILDALTTFVPYPLADHDDGTDAGDLDGSIYFK